MQSFLGSWILYSYQASSLDMYDYLRRGILVPVERVSLASTIDKTVDTLFFVLWAFLELSLTHPLPYHHLVMPSQTRGILDLLQACIA